MRDLTYVWVYLKIMLDASYFAGKTGNQKQLREKR